MDNCFEAARRCGVKHTVFASSVAVSGQQPHFGERLVDETDERRGETQYAVNKIINEWQAHDYRRAYGMTITCIRPANVTGPDKKFGSIDHVNCMCQPARGQSVTFPHADAMRCVIHVEDMAEAFARVLLADKPQAHDLQFRRDHGQPGRAGGAWCASSCPTPISASRRETGGRAISGNYPDRQPPPGRGVRRAVQAPSPAGAGGHQRYPRWRRSAPDRLMRLSRRG